MSDDRTLPPIRVLVVDDHPLVRAGLHTVLGGADGIAVVAEAVDGADAISAFGRHRPDVTLMDLRMPGVDGVGAIRAIRAAAPGARIIALTTYDGDADIRQALDAGAVGYLLKDMLGVEVVRAVRAVLAGAHAIPPLVAARLAVHTADAALTPREREVLAHVARGLRNRAVARAIGRSEETVKTHLASILAKLGATDRTEAVTLAVRRGILRLDENGA